MQPPDGRDTSVPSTILLLGASVRAAAESARRGGFSVLGMDLFGDLDTLAACDRHEFIAPSQCDEPFGRPFANSPAAANLPIIRVGGLGNRPLGGELRSLGPSLTTIQKLKHPAVLGRLATESGLQVPKTIFDGTGFVTGSGRWLQKSHYSSGGTGVTWHKPSSEMNQDSLGGERQPLSHWILQQWVAGRCFGASFFADSVSVSLLGIFRSLFVRRGQNPFLYAGSFGPVRATTSATSPHVSGRLRRALRRFATQTAEQFQLRGLFNVDFIVDDQGDGWVLEINPRWTAASELVERRLIELDAIAASDSLMRWHLLANIEPLRWRIKPDIERFIAGEPNDCHATWIKQIVYADRPGMLDVRRLEAIANRRSVQFADLPPPTRVHRRGEPLLTLIGKLVPNDPARPSTGRTSENHEMTPLRPSQWRHAIRETLRIIQQD